MDLPEARKAVIAAIPPRYRETAVAYLDEVPFRAGETVPGDSGQQVADRPVYLGFIDCQAGKNWAHACLYVLCGVDDDVTDVTEGRLPPRSAGVDRTLTVQAVGALVPSWAVFGQRGPGAPGGSTTARSE
jgi:hypothetical protein